MRSARGACSRARALPRAAARRGARPPSDHSQHQLRPPEGLLGSRSPGGNLGSWLALDSQRTSRSVSSRFSPWRRRGVFSSAGCAGAGASAPAAKPPPRLRGGTRPGPCPSGISGLPTSGKRTEPREHNPRVQRARSALALSGTLSVTQRATTRSSVRSVLCFVQDSCSAWRSQQRGAICRERECGRVGCASAAQSEGLAPSRKYGLLASSGLSQFSCHACGPTLCLAPRGFNTTTTTQAPCSSRRRRIADGRWPRPGAAAQWRLLHRRRMWQP